MIQKICTLVTEISHTSLEIIIINIKKKEKRIKYAENLLKQL